MFKTQFEVMVRRDDRWTIEGIRDDEDRATEREDDEVMEQMGNAGLEELRAIEAALARIEDGIYGVCVSCGEPISAARLDVMPTAAKYRHCM